MSGYQENCFELILNKSKFNLKRYYFESSLYAGTDTISEFWT